MNPERPVTPADLIRRPSEAFQGIQGLMNDAGQFLRTASSRRSLENSPNPARDPDRGNNNGRPVRAPASFTVFEHPEIVFSWASQFPDHIKLRKRLTLWPLQLTLRADYSRRRRAFEYGCSCRDRVFGGLVSLDLPSQRLEYYKPIALGNGASIGVHASCNFRGALAGQPYNDMQLNPMLGFTYELGGGTAVLAGNAFDLRKKLPISRSLALEVCGAAQLPTPVAQYSIENNNRRISMGSGAVSLHVAELNAVVFL